MALRIWLCLRAKQMRAAFRWRARTALVVSRRALWSMWAEFRFSARRAARAFVSPARTPWLRWLPRGIRTARRLPAWKIRTALFAGVGVLALGALGALLLGKGAFASRYGLSHSAIAANGLASAVLRVPASEMPAAGVSVRARQGLVRIVSMEREKDSGDLEIALTAAYRAGEETIEVHGLQSGTGEYRLRLVAAPIDLDADGLPDAAELGSATDRARFRAWFCAIAESQYYKIWDGWIPEQRDCAGLVRFAMREALVRHDAAWLARAGRLLLRSGIPDVAAFLYPEIPFLGTKIFRVRPPSRGTGEDGSYFSIDDFSPFASARIVMNHNCVFLGRGLAGLAEAGILEEGDLLFFDQDDLDVEESDEAMHVMIYLGLRDNEETLVYHTGDPVSGVVRKLGLRTLMRHPDPRWHPDAANPRFLGAYRLALIAEGM